jgi:hypothetical protein
VFLSFFTVVKAEKVHRPPQHSLKSLLLAKKSFPTKSGQKNRRSSPFSTQSIFLSSLLKPPDTKEGVFSERYNTPDSFREGLETRDEEETQSNQAVPSEGDPGEGSAPMSQFSRHYNTPDSFREGYETRDDTDFKDTVNVSPGQFTRQYNTPDKFREGFESRDLNIFETRKQNLMHPEEILQDLNDNEVPDNSPGMFLGLGRDATVPGDESVPEDFRAQDRGEGDSRISSEMKELANMYYNTDNRFARIPEVNVYSEGNNMNHRADSERKAYTEGGLVYLSKQNRGKTLH